MNDFMYDPEHNKDRWQELFGILFVIVLSTVLINHYFSFGKSENKTCFYFKVSQMSNHPVVCWAVEFPSKEAWSLYEPITSKKENLNEK